MVFCFQTSILMDKVIKSLKTKCQLSTHIISANHSYLYGHHFPSCTIITQPNVPTSNNSQIAPVILVFTCQHTINEEEEHCCTTLCTRVYHKYNSGAHFMPYYWTCFSWKQLTFGSRNDEKGSPTTHHVTQQAMQFLHVNQPNHANQESIWLIFCHYDWYVFTILFHWYIIIYETLLLVTASDFCLSQLWLKLTPYITYVNQSIFQ